MIERIVLEGTEMALIIRSNYSKKGIEFFTPDDYSQQIAFMAHPVGKAIDAHIHRRVDREVKLTQEVLVIRKGILRVDFYNVNQVYLESRLLYQGDVILLAGGGHGFYVIEDLEMIEIKQGPYLKEEDKVRFQSVGEESIKIIGEVNHE
jgi:mannose-6-phosphate isomerase-like protein (cupin superfamily)